MNACSLKNQLFYIIGIFNFYMLDALVVTETNLKDSMISAKLRNIGFKLINIMRSLPDGRTNNRVGGGVALLVRKDTRMTLLSQCQAGAFTAAVTATGKPTVIVIGAYIPPLRSTSSSHTTKKLDLRTNKPSSTDKREEIFLYIQTEYLRHHLNYPTTILMDANSRCTSADGERRAIRSAPEELWRLLACLHAPRARITHEDLRRFTTSHNFGRGVLPAPPAASLPIGLKVLEAENWAAGAVSNL